MANLKITELVALTTPASGDVLPVVDVSDTSPSASGETKKITVSNLILNSTQTLTNKTLTSPVINTGVSGTAVLDDDTFGTANATTVATSESIKAYVDTQVTAEDLDFQGDSGTGAVDLDSQSLDIAGGTNVTTVASSQTLTVNLDSTLSGLSSVTSTAFVGDITGDVTGDCTGNAATVTTNANLTGDVTSVGNATTIATDAVDIAMLSATGTASSSTYLRGDNTWATVSGGGDVTKVGTPADSQVGVWTGDGTIEGTGSLVFDSTGLGIGGTPSTKLHVIDGNGGIRVGSSNDWGYIHGRTTGDAAAWFVGYNAANLQIGTSGAVGLQLVTNSSPAVTVDSSGNVGIATNSPNARLEIEDAASGESVLLKVTADDESIYSLIVGNDTYSTSDTDGIGMWINNAGVGKLHTRGTGSSLNLGTAGVDRVYIDTSGNVGIGVTPETGWGANSAALELGDSATDKGALAWNTVSGADYFDWMYQCYFDGTDYKYTTGSAATTRISQRNGGITFDYAAAGVADAAFSWSNGMTITDAGLVGIGTTAPRTYTSVQSNLEVKTSGHGGIAINAGTDSLGMLAFAQNGTHRWSVEMENTATPSLSFNEAGTTRVTIDNGGFVGLGTATPKRHVQIHNAASATTKLQITNGATGGSSDGDGFQLGIGSDGTANIEQRENLDLGITTNNTERIKIKAGGNVGIGGTAAEDPQTRCHIATGDSAMDTYRGTDTPLCIETSNESSFIQFVADSGHAMGIVMGDTSGDDDTARGAYMYDEDGGGAIIKSGGSNQLYISTDGLVGVGGLSASTYALEVHSQSHDGGMLVAAANDNQSTSLSIESKSSGGTAQRYSLESSRSNQNLNFVDATAGATRMVIDSSGNVGIGTAAPTNAKLVVNNSSTSSPVTSMELMGGSIADGGGTGIFLKASTSTTADRFGARINTIREAGGNGAASLVFSTDDSSSLNEALRIDSDGAFGIAGANYGTSGQVLTSGGSGAAPSWADSSGGSSGVTALSEAADVEIDFSGTKHQTLTVTGTCTELSTTSSSLSAGKEIELRIYNNDGGFVGFTPTTPSWKEMGQSITSTGVDPTEYAILKLTSWGTTDADVTAELITQP